MDCAWSRARHKRYYGERMEERRIYNDLARRIQRHFEVLEGENSKRRRRSVKPLTDLSQEQYKEPPTLKGQVLCLYRAVDRATRNCSK